MQTRETCKIFMKKKIEDIVIREDLYPRFETRSAARVQQYATNLAELPPIEVNQDNILIDGWHRLKAHEISNETEVEVKVTKTKDEDHLFELACERNARSGVQMSMKEKANASRKMFRSSRAVDIAVCACC